MAASGNTFMMAAVEILTICMLGNFLFFKISVFENLVQKSHTSVKQFVSRSGPTFCRPRSVSNLFANVISYSDYINEQ